MAWVILILSGVLEAVWALALEASAGLRKLKPTLLFAGGLLASMLGLAWAMRTLPTGTSYAVWVGTGATLTLLWALVRGSEKASWQRIGLLLLLVGCVVGLKVVS